MEYLVGAAVMGVVVFLLVMKSRVSSFNKSCLLPFSSWRAIYSSGRTPDKTGMARALILQTLHLATKSGALSSAENKEIESGLSKEDPVKIVDEWLEMALPNVFEVCGVRDISTLEARLVGVFMLVSLKGVNPQGDLRRFLQKFNH